MGRQRLRRPLRSRVDIKLDRASDGTTTIDLGLVNGHALITCVSYVYWRISVSSQIQMRRWRPGMAEIEIVYTQDQPTNVPDAYQLGLSGCADGIFTMRRFHLVGDLSEGQVLALAS